MEYKPKYGDPQLNLEKLRTNKPKPNWMSVDGMPTEEEKASRDFWFGSYFHPKQDCFIYSSWRILSEITPEDQILDIGCGYNVYKPALGDRIYGIDPAFDPGQEYEIPETSNFKTKKGSGEHDPLPHGYGLVDKHGSGIGPDEKISWDDYVPHKEFNVFFCLGSLQFGSETYVESQVKKLAETCKAGNRVYWRQNPGSQTDNPHPGKKDKDGNWRVRHFPWTFEKNHEWANKYGFKILDLRWDTNNRIYSKWIKQ